MTSGTEGRLAGKVAIITGAARGQGAREARLFVEHGARVVITDVLEDQLRALAKIAAIELGPLGVRVNSIHPGPIDTDMLPPARAGDADRFGGLPLARVGSVDEVAALVLYLASDDASFITGAEISIDGGMSAGLVPRHARNR